MSKLKSNKKKRFKKINQSLIVSSARKLDLAQLDQIKKIFGAEKVITKIDPDLVGGVKIQRGDRLFDGTVKTELEEMKAEIVG